jgi:hypothetical protein
MRIPIQIRIRNQNTEFKKWLNHFYQLIKGNTFKSFIFHRFLFFPAKRNTASMSPGPDSSIELTPEPDPDLGFC